MSEGVGRLRPHGEHGAASGHLSRSVGAWRYVSSALVTFLLTLVSPPAVVSRVNFGYRLLLPLVSACLPALLSPTLICATSQDALEKRVVVVVFHVEDSGSRAPDFGLRYLLMVHLTSSSDIGHREGTGAKRGGWGSCARRVAPVCLI